MVRIDRPINWRMLAFSLFFTVQAVMIPVRQAQAVIPVLGAVGAFLKTPLGKAYATSVSIHAGVLAIEFHDWATSPSVPPDDTTKRLEVKINPKDPMKTPAGWTAPSGGSVEPVAPATATGTTSGTTFTAQKWSMNVAGPFFYGPLVMAKLDYCLSQGGLWSGYDSTNNRCTNDTGGTSGYINFTYGPTATSTCRAGYTYVNPNCVPVTTCPAGYTASGSVCNKTDETLVVKPSDNMMEIKRVGNVLYTDARDSLDGVPPGATVTPNKVEFTDSFGGKWEYVTNADGTSYSRETKPRTDGSGKTDELTTAFTAPDGSTGAVAVSGMSNKVFTGTGTLQSPTADGAPSAGTGSDPCGAPGQPKCAVTADETGTDAGTGAAKADALKAQIDAQKDAAVASQGSGNMSVFGIPNFTTPAASGTEPQFGLAGSDGCVNPSGTLFGQSNFVFPICTVVGPLKTILAWMLNVFLAMYAWSAYTRRPQGGT